MKKKMNDAETSLQRSLSPSKNYPGTKTLTINVQLGIGFNLNRQKQPLSKSNDIPDLTLSNTTNKASNLLL